MEPWTGVVHASTTAESWESSCMEGDLYLLMTINIRDPTSLKAKKSTITKVIIDKLIGLLSKYLASLKQKKFQVMGSMHFFLCPLIQFVYQLEYLSFCFGF